MNMKFALSMIAIAGLAMSANKSYSLRLYEPAMVGDTQLKAGEYKVEVTDDQKAVIKGDKFQKEATVKVENSDSKFTATTVRLSAGEKRQIQEIRLGGTKTKLVFSDSAGAAGM